MKASVIVPVYNDPRIEACLSSLLAQDFPRDSYEIIVVDNNSIPAIGEIIHRFPVTYLQEKSQGACFARNRGLEAASGEIAAFIDADCVADPCWLSNLLGGFKHPQIGGVGGKILKLQPRTWVQAAAEDLAEQQLLLQFLPFFPAPYIVTANAAYRMSILREIDGLDTQLLAGEDVDLAWRVVLSGFELAIASDAVVYHAARETVKGYFKQYFQYAWGHVLLFKKHRQVTERKFFINTYPFRGLTYLLLSVLTSVFIRGPSGKSDIEKETTFLNLIKYIALVLGNLYGAIKYRIPYL